MMGRWIANAASVFFLYTTLLVQAAFCDNPLPLKPGDQKRCLKVLREGMHAGDFWPAIHAAEALTLAGQTDEVRAFLLTNLATETDDQKRCGLARELVRTGELKHCEVMLKILRKGDQYGHVHAAESLYKVGWHGDAGGLREAFTRSDNLRLRLMAAAALAKHGDGAEKRKAYQILRETVRNEPEPEVFRVAVWILARIGDQRDIELIRSRQDDCEENPLTLAFVQHALAALGDSMGQSNLMDNLNSADPAIRTYAAVFAGESGMTQAAPLLIGQLEDDNADARIRAAQALIVLSK